MKCSFCGSKHLVVHRPGGNICMACITKAVKASGQDRRNAELDRRARHAAKVRKAREPRPRADELPDPEWQTIWQRRRDLW